MYKIIENPHFMTKAEIDSAYKGKWVYIVKADINPHGRLIEGMPVVLGEFQFDGVEEGIYERFKKKEYEERLSYTLLPNDDTISSVFGTRLANEC
uniref:Uncharacterized protein n=1 Tax=uncultured bacterium contig00025 TaxID=1181514 RepID=A0A806K0Z2_9BACT|nr:hypothetical protein [uncultured bacterium contig00025]